jgi:hypothetical protein
MDEHIENNSVAKTAEEALSFWERHRLSLLLIITVIIAITMTSISVAIYNSSGAAQLDLSRPGYLSVSDKVQTNDDINTYSASGAVNKETIEEFIKLYDAQVSKAMKVDAFNGDPLNPEVLEFGTPSNQ